MKTARTALLAASGLIASTLFAAAQTGDLSAGPLANEPLANETSSPPAADATATMRAMLRDRTITDSAVPSENAYDFNAPGCVPGFGPLDSVSAAQRLAQIVIWE